MPGEGETFAREGLGSWRDLWGCAGGEFDERKVLEQVATARATRNVAPSKDEEALAP